MWQIQYVERFEEWLWSLSEIDRQNVWAGIYLLQERGPMLPRPHADTVNGSRYSNMKELRVQSQGRPLRVFFAFDPERRGVLLCAGDKTGNERFYEEMIPVADREYAAHLGQS
ncbi:type II toxin-antitoxin system RelE/ParE family toxin [Halorhodospira halochloris]|uniref:type II toxin-antitoxin system RelE/ParE family toxin n=1 Tax=Halorhodospira halochloris TaxID=1052 RepID=UPI001EE8BBB6|nr:type II toxin-antitoxin system RelE/ParE family toxin [Halorhodospira halochloris]MCG5531392.1 type II toxin-antitoxin system RelE/ParE family toxin [Halorhodospira halochloris]MCG5549195.1 type II toxin-antitoxin system RelE/ParE family toxin [Halorhodospira halochloris]